MPPFPAIPRRHLACFGLISGLLAGCATHPAGVTTAPVAETISRPGQAVDPRASLAINQITPIPELSAPPLTATNGQPPLDALMLYARARVDEQNDQRLNAISHLEQAARVDPNSFAIQHELARLYLSMNAGGEQAETALERAAVLKPDDLETQTDLGRVYLSRNETAKATDHFRLATQTTEYRNDADPAAITDYYLAQSLQQQGYDRAALDSYARLLQRLQNAPSSVRDNPEIQFWLSRPELLYAEVGRLREKQGDTAAALAAYGVVAERSPDDLDTRAHMITLLVSLNRRDDAARLAMDTISHTHASPQSLEMLRDVYRGDDQRAVAALETLHNQHPQDRTVLFALADVLVADGETPKAVATLSKAVATTRDVNGAGDTQTVDKLFHLLSDQGKTIEAAKLLIETSARRPDTVGELLDNWMELVATTRAGRLHVEQVQAMDLPPEMQAARSYWVARIAVGRPELLKSALADSVAHQPPYRPAYRFALAQMLCDPSIAPDTRGQQIDALIAPLAKSDPALRDELLGIVDLSKASSASHSGDGAGANALASTAVAAFERSQQQGNLGPDLRTEMAQAELLKPDAAAYERIMWKLLSDRPDDDSGYTELFHYYQDSNQTERSVAVSQSWLLADPNNLNAQLLHILLLSRAGVKVEANKAITDLYHAHPDNQQVLDVAEQIMGRHDDESGDSFVALLEARVVQQPGDLLAVSRLVSQYLLQKRTGEAVRLIDNARTAVAHDGDQLYYVAHLYDLTAMPGDVPANGALTPTEQTLQMALKVDPNNAGASNDLGYEWADEGKHLIDAESLIRRAIELEPDNGAYLDSLGWVLYKRGRFDESKQYLQKAAEPFAEADPVVLNHLGDDLYRLNQNVAAQHTWQESLSRLDERLKLRDEESGGAPPAGSDELGPLKPTAATENSAARAGIAGKRRPDRNAAIERAAGESQLNINGRLFRFSGSRINSNGRSFPLVENQTRQRRNRRQAR